MAAKRQETPDILGDVLTWRRPAEPVQPEPEQIQIDRIRADGGTQMRAQLDDPTVFEYAQAMIDANSWGPFPPAVVFYDGSTYWLGDGFHRLAAFKEAFIGAGRLAVPCEVRAGDRRDAILFAAGANASHGLRRTNADKKRSVETLLRDGDWAVWSDNEIARRCNVSPTFVGGIRKSISLSTVDSEKPAAAPAERTYTTKHGTTATMKTGSIGRKPSLSTVDSETPTSAEQRQYDMQAVRISVPQPPAAAPAPAAPAESAGDLPADLAGRGWELRRVAGIGKFYCHNRGTRHATRVFDRAADAIQAAYDMQVDLAWEEAQQAPAAPVEDPDEDETIARMWNLRTAQGVLENMAEYWQAATTIDILVQRDPASRTGLKVSLGLLLHGTDWRTFEAPTLEEAAQKADRSL